MTTKKMNIKKYNVNICHFINRSADMAYGNMTSNKIEFRQDENK